MGPCPGPKQARAAPALPRKTGFPRLGRRLRAKRLEVLERYSSSALHNRRRSLCSQHDQHAGVSTLLTGSRRGSRGRGVHRDTSHSSATSGDISPGLLVMCTRCLKSTQRNVSYLAGRTRGFPVSFGCGWRFEPETFNQPHYQAFSEEFGIPNRGRGFDAGCQGDWHCQARQLL